jgi:hypothetical protein
MIAGGVTAPRFHEVRSNGFLENERQNMIDAILIKPLDGKKTGDEVQFSQTDFDMLAALGAVVKKPEAKSEKKGK